MVKKIEKVAVLGTGIMGSQISAHLANAGIPSYAFDLTQEIAEKGIEAATKVKPNAFYKPKNVNLITPVNYDEHLDALAEVDWVIEVVAERLDIKLKLFDRVLPKIKENAIISSNTSGLNIKDMMAKYDKSVQKRFLITHFFNPPRYMKLLEIVRGEFTDPAVVELMVDFGENVLGKGIVYAKDTPNFVANRIGVYGMMKTIATALSMGLTVEEVDKLTGPIAGRPKSATFRTADLVGLDTLMHVAENTYNKCVDDEEREIFQIPEILKKLVEEGRLGQKSREGFYKKVGKEIMSLDFKSFDYTPQKKVKFDAIRVAKGLTTIPEKVTALAYSDDIAGKFFWEVLSSTLIYSANRIPEITDDVVNVDNAMKWGFGWEMGPFETWDAIGLEKSLERMTKEGKKIPAWVKEMYNGGQRRFYEMKEGRRYFYDYATKTIKQQPAKEKELNLKLLKETGNLIKRNWSASLVDLGDGILCVEFHSALQPTMNPIDGSIVDTLNDAIELAKKDGWKGVVIGHDGTHFSAGANLALIQRLCEEKDWDTLEQVSKALQDTTQALKFAPFPVVAAPFNYTLGGGFEIIGACDKIVAHAELYCGAVEVGVGLIPGAGGNLRILLNWMDRLTPMRPGFMPPTQKAFETIAFAKVSTSAEEAIFHGYLRKSDRIVINRDQLLYTAKEEALKMSKGYKPPEYREDIRTGGEGARLAIESSVEGFLRRGMISEHDAKIAGKLAWVLTGGEKGGWHTPVDEQYMLDIEREAFVSLAGEKLSQDRIAYMLRYGKPLRN